MVKEGVVSRRVRQIHKHSSGTEPLDFGNVHAPKPGTTHLRAMSIRPDLSLSNRIPVDKETIEKVPLHNPKDMGSFVELSRQSVQAANMNHECPRTNNASRVTAYPRSTSNCNEPGSKSSQGFACEVPRVIYARVPRVECPVGTPEDIGPLTAATFDIEASISTFSSSWTTSPGSDVGDNQNAMRENAVKKMSTSQFRDSKQQSATHPVKCPSSQLNPNADEFVPSKGLTMPSSRRGTLANVFGRTSLKPNNRTGGQRILRCIANFPSPRVNIRASINSVPDIVGSNHRFPFMTGLTPNITVLSAELKIFVVDLLSEQECDWILHHTEQHVENSVHLGTETWRKLFTHTQFDLPCCEVLPLRPMTNQLLIHIRQIIGHLFKARRAASRLAPRSWKEPHLLRYQKVPGKPEHTGMIMHFDGGHMTWQLMLSDHETEYTGK